MVVLGTSTSIRRNSVAVETEAEAFRHELELDPRLHLKQAEAEAGEQPFLRRFRNIFSRQCGCGETVGYSPGVSICSLIGSQERRWNGHRTSDGYSR